MKVKYAGKKGMMIFQFTPTKNLMLEPGKEYDIDADAYNKSKIMQNMTKHGALVVIDEKTEADAAA